jgi:secretion/DNA translocation related TadE-like protein
MISRRYGTVAHGLDDQGSATVCVLGACVLLVAWGLAALLVCSATLARHRATSAADLGALAGARWTIAEPERACRSAGATVRANGGYLVACWLDGVDIVITVTVPVAGAPPGLGPARATARAGPTRT